MFIFLKKQSDKPKIFPTQNVLFLLSLVFFIFNHCPIFSQCSLTFSIKVWILFIFFNNQNYIISIMQPIDVYAFRFFLMLIFQSSLACLILSTLLIRPDQAINFTGRFKLLLFGLAVITYFRESALPPPIYIVLHRNKETLSNSTSLFWT